ncbi:uncharacterized protein LOC130788277 [Actinidia eriantha]|uniref:uncharacterized protein LOC130788277 n=1 Tax=Actinidia eriantha TaxID=165200 RepID=UPI002587ACB9|nr:uncharacterized protein LOC130788277 [Actinidia eriantha]
MRRQYQDDWSAVIIVAVPKTEEGQVNNVICIENFFDFPKLGRMKKYFSSVPKIGSSPSPLTTEIVPPLVTEKDQPLATDDVPKQKENDRINLDEFKLESDPCLRNKIRSYPCNLQDSYSRAYWLKVIGDQTGGEIFVDKGFTNWKKKEKFDEHVGGVNSAHYQVWRKCQDLVHQPQHIDTAYNKHSEQSKVDYRIRLCATIDCIRFLLKQGLAFRGHDESEDSDNQGNFLELLEFLYNHNNEVEAAGLKNAPENLRLVSLAIQKDIVNAAAIEILNVIINDIGDECFSILVNESRDVSIKEQMAVVMRYVNFEGHVFESFLGLEHVTNTTAISLKEAIETLFLRHKLSIYKLRGQGYDGASNMRGEFKGLKTLKLKENPTAY